MTIDLLIVTLVTLSFVLLLGFAGCSVPDVKFRDPLTLEWEADFDITDIASIAVTFTYEPAIGEAPSNLVAHGTFAASDFKALSYIDLSNQLDLSDQPDGTLRCSCHITMTTGPQPNDANAPQFKHAGTPPDPFVLSRAGNVFTLTVGSEGAGGSDHFSAVNDDAAR